MCEVSEHLTFLPKNNCEKAIKQPIIGGPLVNSTRCYVFTFTELTPLLFRAALYNFHRIVNLKIDLSHIQKPLVWSRVLKFFIEACSSNNPMARQIKINYQFLNDCIFGVLRFRTLDTIVILYIYHRDSP